MSIRTASAIALVSAALVAAPLAPASANDGRHAAFGLGAAVGVLAMIATAPFRAFESAPAPRAYGPPVAYYPAYYPPPAVYYAPPAYAYAPAPGYYYPAR